MASPKQNLTVLTGLYREALEEERDHNLEKIEKAIREVTPVGIGGAATGEEQTTSTALTGLRLFSGYMSVDGRSFSNIKLKHRAESLSRPGAGTLEHHISISGRKGDYMFVSIKHRAFEAGLPNAHLGETRIPIQDINNMTVKTVEDKEELAELIKAHYPGNIDLKVLGGVVVEFDTANIEHNMNWLTRESLYQFEHGQSIRSDMVSLADHITEAMRKKTTSHFKFLVGQTDNSRRAYEEMVMRAKGWTQVVTYMQDTKNPLNYWLRKHPDVKTVDNLKVLPFQDIPDISNFEELGMYAKHTRFQNPLHMMLLHLIGCKFEHLKQKTKIEELSSRSFDAVMLACPGMDGECLMIVMPESRQDLLPADGEPCRVVLPVRPVNEATSLATEVSETWGDQTDNESPPPQEPANIGYGCSAIRLDIPTLQLKSDWQVYLVKQSNHMSEQGLEFDVKETQPGEAHDAFLARVTSFDERQSVMISRIDWDKPMKKHVQAANMLLFPNSMGDKASKLSNEALDYLVRFEEAEGAFTNLHEKLPGLNGMSDGTAPGWLRDRITRMDSAKLAALENLKHMPGHVAFIPGVAASGKSTFATNLFLLLLFGQCGAETPVEECTPSGKKLLYCVNNNAAIDTFARRTKKTIDGLGVKGVDIVRLYSYDSEVSNMTPHLVQAKPFDEKATAIQRDAFTETDKLLATYMMTDAAIRIHQRERGVQASAGACRDMSLQEAASEYHRQNTARDSQFDELLESVRSGYALAAEDLCAFEKGTERLYKEFLGQFGGIICATPIAAADNEFKTNYKADLVVLDEGGRLAEIDTFTTLAFHDAPVVLLGDPQQLAPYIDFDATAKNDYNSQNPMAAILLNSTLARAVDAGAVKSYLTFNHRAFASLFELPSKLIYRGQMTPYDMMTQFPEAARRMRSFLCQIKPDLKSNRMMVTLPGAFVSNIGPSTCNLAHARWIVGQAIRAVKDNSLTNVDGGPIDVLIMAYYRAQVETIRLQLSKALNAGKIHYSRYKHIRVQTLDSSQGDEADLVFVDYTRTDDMGFCGDERRQCLTLTRGRLAEIILAGPAMYLGAMKKPDLRARATVIERMYVSLADENAVHNIPACAVCEQPDPDHDAVDCPFESPTELPSDFCRCRQTKHTPKHHPKLCTAKFCDICDSKGHRTSTCAKSVSCHRCHSTNHRGSECKKPIVCRTCGKRGHYAHDCASVCHHCQTVDHHQTEDCPRQRCRRCNGYGHSNANCPVEADVLDTVKARTICDECNKPGHLGRYCTEPRSRRTCYHCGLPGHMKRDCPTKPPKRCHVCKKEDHLIKDCPFESMECGPVPDDDGERYTEMEEKYRAARDKYHDLISTGIQTDIGSEQELGTQMTGVETITTAIQTDIGSEQEPGTQIPDFETDTGSKATEDDKDDEAMLREMLEMPHPASW